MSVPEEPFIELNLAGSEFKATPRNSQLFTFAGYATLENGEFVLNPQSRNHVFLETHEPDGEVMHGTYIFQPEIVQQMGAVMIRYGFPCRLNQRYIQQCDENAYLQYIEQNADYEADEMGDFLPEGWDGDS